MACFTANNKLVAFNMDIGRFNQGVFHSFDINMNSGQKKIYINYFYHFTLLQIQILGLSLEGKDLLLTKLEFTILFGWIRIHMRSIGKKLQSI
jgi:hypothetical protein